MNKPLVSVVMPIYNTESYLSEAIESVVTQSIGFKDQIELILVDDGSTDGSSGVVQRYKSSYPNNIIYIKQQNSGVSRARNVGIEQAQGRYIHFFDSDDIIAPNFYERIVSFFNSEPSINFVAAKLMFFDEIIDSHPLNYKFKTSRVIDIEKTPGDIILHVISGVFRREAVAGIEFDESISIAEDIKFISDFLSRTPRYGVVSDTTYYYRKRSDASSAIATSRRNKASYTDVIDGVYAYILKLWSGRSRFAEEIILYDLSYRLDHSEQNVLTDDEQKTYIESVFTVIRDISSHSISINRFLTIHQKLFLLKIKHGESLQKHLRVSEQFLSFDNVKFYNLGETAVFLDFLTPLGGDRYKIEGYIKGISQLAGVDYQASCGESIKQLKFVDRSQREKSFLGNIYDKGGAFEVIVDFRLNSALSFQLLTNDGSIGLPIQTGRYTRLGALRWTYRRDIDRLLKRQTTNIEALPYSRGRHLLLELRMLLQILLNWRVNTFRQRLAMLRSRNLDQLGWRARLVEYAKPLAFSIEAVAYIPRDILLRIVYYIAKNFKKRPIWLVSDRSMAARDNGEAMFRYIMSREDCPADVYFVMSRKSRDLERMKLIGPVLYQESLRFKLMFLLSDKIIASQADIETTNPFIRLLDRYVDLFEFDFIFLQHGIIRHNLSSWLNRFEKNISLFITSAEREYQSIFTNPYYYTPDKVLLSGLARYDYLDSKPAGKLILAPTYRKNLVRMKTDSVGRRGYDPSFKSSQYREFYNNLINDPRLLEALKSHNMTGEFYLHPVFSEQRSDFDENDSFKLMKFPYDYQKAFSEGSLLISDHSSVVFDFAYLKKPVAYAHFDVKTFFAGHSYDESNFFSDEDDGFGAVYYDYESLVNGVVDSIKNDCQMTDKYISRVDNFFYKVDKNNSRRIYEAIIAMKR